MKEKIKKVVNKILNTRIFVIIICTMLFIKTIYFYKNTISISEPIEFITMLGTLTFLTTIMCFLMILM